MSFFLWIKNLFVEDDITEEVKEEIKEELKNSDYKLRIFDLQKRDELNEVTSFIVQDKTIALIKMYKFTGDHSGLKEVLSELKQTCDNCNSKVVGVNNNLFLVVKNSVELLKD